MKATKMVAVLLLGMPMVSLATPITFEFTGNVTFVSDPQGLDHGIAAGSGFTGSFTFDDAVAPFFTNSEFAAYVNLISAFDVSFDGLGFTAAALPLGPSSPQTSDATVSNNRAFDGRDGFSFQSALAPLGSDPDSALFYRSATLFGVSSNNALFADTSLPTSLDLAEFDYVPLLLSVTYQVWNSPSELVSDGQISGQLTSVRVANTGVPEPSALALMAAGFGMLVFAGRRRKVQFQRE